MPSIRFANPDLQALLLKGLDQLPFAVSKSADGTVTCTEDQWPEVNAVAHKVRDSCFKWYFQWSDSDDATRELAAYLNASGLRHELEYHGDRVVFLLPKSEREKHTPPAEDYDGPEKCSFCGASPLERESFFVAAEVAICDHCIESFHDALHESEPRDTPE